MIVALFFFFVPPPPTELNPLSPLPPHQAPLPILPAEPYRTLAAPPVKGLRLASISAIALQGADDHVANTYRTTLQILQQQGAIVDGIDLPEFRQLPSINRLGGFTGAESWAWHRGLLAEHADAYDPRVSTRIARGQNMGAADYIDVQRARPHWIAGVESRLHGYDAQNGRANV